MKKDSFVPKGIHFDKKLDDGFLNLYEEGIFVRCFEYSAILLSEFTGYKLFANIEIYFRKYIFLIRKLAEIIEKSRMLLNKI